jgi:hypothetical protein
MLDAVFPAEETRMFPSLPAGESQLNPAWSTMCVDQSTNLK